MINYFTRSGVVSSEKLKVYVTGHPLDRDTYIQQAHNSMLNLYNCVVCIADNEEISDEEYESLCSDISLAVIVVSRRFLEESNRARESEYPYLCNRNIRIMPIVVEENLGVLFREKMGHIQYLNIASTDSTARSVEERATEFLNPILGKVEDCKQYKSGFSIKGFISYRKKDRAVLLELMKMIRSESQCDVMGFWYDEMLTLGEVYSDEIQEAIDDNLLFVLMITPNLLEEGNYVWKHEYRRAKEKSKLIWPVMLEPLSDEQLIKLNDMYEGLPKIITREDVIKKFGRLASDFNSDYRIKDTDKYAYVMYCRGMAYMTGILTTFDLEKGIEYLEKAAGSGSVAAYKQLFVTYYDGYKSINQDIEKAIYWQSHLLDYLKSIEQSTNSLRIIEGIFSASVQLADIYRTCGALDNALMEYVYLINRAELMNMDERVACSGQLLMAYTNGALLFRAKGDNDTADKLLFRNDELNKVVSSQSADGIQMDRNWFVTAIQRMDAYFRDDVQRVDEALNTYMECLTWAQEQYNANPTAEALSDLASAYERLGDVYRVLADHGNEEVRAKSLEQYRLSYQYGMKARAEDNTMIITINQLNRAHRIAEANLSIGNEDNIFEARTYLNKVANGFNLVQQSLGIKGALANMPYIIKVYEWMHNVYMILGDKSSADIANQNIKNILDAINEP